MELNNESHELLNADGYRNCGKACVLALVLLLIIFTGGTRPASAVEISGVVTDRGSKEPIPLVEVSIKIGAKVFTAHTDSKGQYHLADVPPGQITVTFSRSDYVRDPTEEKISIANDKATELNEQLMKFVPDDGQYLQKLADSVVEAVGTQSDKESAIRTEWKRIEESGLPLKSQVLIAKAILKKVPSYNPPALRNCAELDSARVAQLDEAMSNALFHDSPLPAKSNFDEVVPKEDTQVKMLRAQLMNPQAGSEERTEFLSKVQQTYGQATATRLRNDAASQQP
jgi:hypothetical protein